jgi:hypothetical protein
MIQWRTTPPNPADADPFGMVRWDPRLPGMLIRWDEVRPGEQWAHSSAWTGAEPDANRYDALVHSPLSP